MKISFTSRRRPGLWRGRQKNKTKANELDENFTSFYLQKYNKANQEYKQMQVIDIDSYPKEEKFMQ